MNDVLKQAVDKEYKTFLMKVSAGVICAFVVIAGFILFNGLGYFEDSLTYFVLALVVFLAGLHFSIYYEIIFAILINAVLVITVLVLMSNSIDFRRNYVDNGFLLEAYIDEYPSYMDTLLHGFGFGSNVVSFSNDCLGTIDKPADHKKLPESCAGMQAVQENYGIDLAAMIKHYHAKMKKTARAISDGKPQMIGYPACINRKSCGYVPLPPSTLTEKEIEESTNPDVTILRDGFWDLLDRSEITPRVCANMFLCNKLVRYEILQSYDFKQIQRSQNPKYDEQKQEEGINFNQIK